MTETTASAPPPDRRSDPTAYVQAWVDGLAQVLTQISGSPLTWTALAESQPELTSAAGDDLRKDDSWILCASSGGLRGEMSLRIPAASALRLAQIFMSEPAASENPAPSVEAPSALTAENREAVAELLRQVAGLVASAVKADWGEVQLRLDPAPGAPSWPASAVFWLRSGTDSPPVMLVEMHLSAALVAGLRTEKAEAAASGLAAPVPPHPDESRAQLGLGLGLLMDVELALTLRFGSRRLLLREVLDLSPGAVVELDRKVEDPVDLLLDGRLVARGEVVVLNGNYGVRVTEVAPASP
ncbi:MAG: flagellar motor switch protein FliN [Candidatus Sulfotelmatobacter sp.]